MQGFAFVYLRYWALLHDVHCTMHIAHCTLHNAPPVYSVYYSGQLKYLDRLWLEGNKIDNFPEVLPLAAELDDLRIGSNG